MSRFIKYAVKTNNQVLIFNTEDEAVRSTLKHNDGYDFYKAVESSNLSKTKLKSQETYVVNDIEYHLECVFSVF